MTRLFRDESGYPLNNAQRNLQGRTHYVDDATLKCFKSRVLSCTISHGGLILTIVESVALDPSYRSRGFRFVAFDIFGNVIERQKFDDAFKTSKQASRAKWEFLNGLNAVKHTQARLADKVKQDKREALEIAATLRKLKKEKLV